MMLLMSDRDGVASGRDMVWQAQRALARVLWALFVYSQKLGLKRAPFW